MTNSREWAPVVDAVEITLDNKKQSVRWLATLYLEAAGVVVDCGHAHFDREAAIQCGREESERLRKGRCSWKCWG